MNKIINNCMYKTLKIINKTIEQNINFENIYDYNINKKDKLYDATLYINSKKILTTDLITNMIEQLSNVYHINLTFNSNNININNLNIAKIIINTCDIKLIFNFGIKNKITLRINIINAPYDIINNIINDIINNNIVESTELNFTFHIANQLNNALSNMKILNIYCTNVNQLNYLSNNFQYNKIIFDLLNNSNNFNYANYLDISNLKIKTNKLITPNNLKSKCLNCIFKGISSSIVNITYYCNNIIFSDCTKLVKFKYNNGYKINEYEKFIETYNYINFIICIDAYSINKSNINKLLQYNNIIIIKLYLCGNMENEDNFKANPTLMEYVASLVNNDKIEFKICDCGLKPKIKQLFTLKTLLKSYEYE